MKDLIEAFVAVVVVVAALFATTLLRAFVISCLWGWYIVPFFGMSALPLAVAFGIGVFANYLANSTGGAEEKSFGEIVGFHLGALGAGWLGSLFI